MNCTKSKKLHFFAFLLISVIVPLYGYESQQVASEQTAPLEIPKEITEDHNNESTPVEIPKEIIEEHNNYVENVLKNLLVNYNGVDLILEDLALIIGNGQIHAIKNKREVIEEIKNLRGLIGTIKNDSYVQVDLYKIALLNKILVAIIGHIDQGLANDFKNFPHFAIEQHIKRSIQSLETVQDLDEEFAKVPQQLEQLTKNAQNAGLHWYNKIYRVIDRHIIEPCDKYHIPRRTGKFLFGAFVAYLLWFHTDRGTKQVVAVDGHGAPIMDGQGSHVLVNVAPVSHAQIAEFKNSENLYYGWEYWLRYKVGPRPHFNSKMGDITNSMQLGWFGEFERKLIEYNSGLMPMAALCIPYVASVYGNELGEISDWFSKKAHNVHNFLKGGVFRNKVAQTEKERLEPKITFDDIVGMDHAKEVLSLIVKYIEAPERWDRSKLTPEKGYLLTGPARSGKSYIAEALAGEIKTLMKKLNRNPDEFGFYVIKASYIAQHGIAEILAMAKREAPCVLFIDEIDLLSLQRTGNKEMLSEFLQSMGGAIENDPGKQVIILAATNKPENIDFALKQRGRFGKEIRFEYPNFDNRKLFMLKKLNALAVDTDQFDIDKITYETEGYSFEDLNSMIKRAFQKAKINSTVLSQQMLDESLDSEIRNIIMNDYKKLPENEKRILAAHQAGHALATLLIETGKQLSKVTIRPITSKLKEENVWDGMYKAEDEKQKPTEYGQIFTFHSHDTINVMSLETKLNLCKMHLAGHIAEEILIGSCGFSYHAEDNQKALDIAKTITFAGIKIDTLPKKKQNELFDKAFEIVKKCETEVRQLLTTNKDTLEIIATALQNKETLTRQQIDELLNPKSTVTVDQPITQIKVA